MQIEMVLASEPCVLGVKVVKLEVDRPRPAHVTAFRIELSSEKGMDNE